MQWLNVVQNTDKWLNMRIGKVGGSSIGSIMANYGNSFGPPAHNAALDIALEKITGIRQESSIKTKHMDRGHEQEPIARMLYQDRTFTEVTNGGYFDISEFEGISPDGLVYHDGIIEIKCLIKKYQFATIKRNAYDPKYKWQLAFNLKGSEREWIDYVQYCSEFPTGKNLFIQRLTPVDFTEEFKMIDIRMKQFKSMVENKMEVINRIS